MKLTNIVAILTGRLAKNISYAELAKALGVSRQYANQIKNKELTEKQIKDIESYFGVNIKEQHELVHDECVNIPVRGEVVASMGYGVTVYNEQQTAAYSISKKLVDDLGLSKNKTEMIFAQGDSMMPTIEGGDSLLVDLSRTDIYDGKMYGMRIDGQLYVKRLQKIPPKTIRIVSDNDKYRCFEIDLEKNPNYDFQVIGEVRWWGRVAR